MSIENSLLYSSLEAKVEERTQDLSKAVNDINSLLKEVTALKESQDAFEGFEGSMLMSLILGLVDEAKGTIYFINADHPDMVIYRNEKAEYIYNHKRFQKIGTKGQTGNISISLFQMQPGDTLILGSDGRDDLILNAKQANGNEIRNMDANLFLGIVKDTAGDLHNIYERIVSHGKIIDDLSLIRISFKENSGQLNRNSSNLDSILSLMEISKEAKDFEKYYDLGQKLIL